MAYSPKGGVNQQTVQRTGRITPPPAMTGVNPDGTPDTGSNNPFGPGYDFDPYNMLAGSLYGASLGVAASPARPLAPFLAKGAQVAQNASVEQRAADDKSYQDAINARAVFSGNNLVPGTKGYQVGGTGGASARGSTDSTGAPRPAAPDATGAASSGLGYSPPAGDSSTLNGIANQAFSYGQQNRDWLMGQNATAQNYYQPATQAYQGMYGPGGTMTGPGTGEQAFSEMGRSVLNQTPIQSYQQQTAGELGQAGAGENAYGYMMQNGLGGPGAFEQGAGSYRQGLAQPGAAQQYNQQAGGQLQQPGQLERNSGGYDAQLSRPGAAEQYQQQVGGQLQQGGNAQSAYNRMGGAYQADTALEKAYGGLMGQYGQQGLQQQAAPGQAASLQGGQSQDVYAKQSGQLDQQGQLEKFAASDLAGSNPYYKQLGEQGRAALDQEYNAGGNFNSGARMAALAKYQGNLDAQQYQQEAALQGQAQQATNTRLGQQAGLAGQASGEQLGRTQAQAGLYAGADQQQLSRLGAQAGLAGDVSGQSLNYLNSGMNAAQGADSSNLARLGLGGQLAQGAQSGQQGRIGQQAGIDQNAQSAQLARLGLGGNLAQNADQSSYQRLTAGAGLLSQEQQAQMSRLGMVGQYGNNAQSQELARLGLGGNLANQSTQAGFQQYNDYLNQAQNSQAASQGRQQLGFQDAFQQGNAQAGLQQGFANNASDAYAQMVQAGLGANVNAIGLQQQQRMSDQAMQLAYLGLGLKGATSLSDIYQGIAGGGQQQGGYAPNVNIGATGGSDYGYTPGIDYGYGGNNGPTDPSGTVSGNGNYGPESWDNPYGTG